ncbi:phage tail protein, partial [Enterobacter hormaechei]
EWMEMQIYPAIAGMDGLSDLLTVMVPQGYDYQRDDSLGLWSSADMKYSITYDM